MTIPFKPFPELFIDAREDGVARICSTKGEDVLLVLEGDRAVLDRLVECWNACRRLYGPANHIDATEDYVKRLEGLRKDAWARVQELEAQLASAENSERAGNPFPALTHRAMHENPVGSLNHSTPQESVP